MIENKQSIKRLLRKELVTLALLALIGVLLLPLSIYFVGAEIFGEYAGHGFGDFYRDLHGKLRAGNPVVTFLMISPYLVWQLMRTTFFIFRRMAPSRHRGRA